MACARGMRAPKAPSYITIRNVPRSLLSNIISEGENEKRQFARQTCLTSLERNTCAAPTCQAQTPCAPGIDGQKALAIESFMTRP